jgi:hypothetical protein
VTLARAVGLSVEHSWGAGVCTMGIWSQRPEML